MYCVEICITIPDIPTADSFNAVDVFNSETSRWSTAQLIPARDYISAATVGTLSIFAGGSTRCAQRIELVYK